MFRRILATEFLKLRRSKITWLSLLAYSIGPAVGGLFMWILSEPDRAKQLGLLGTKAQFAGTTADWPTLFGLLIQITGIGGMILLAVIAAYVFGREYAEGTAKNLLVLPLPRWAFVVAKLVVVLVWFAVLAVCIFVEALAVGSLVGLSGLTTAVVLKSAAEVGLVALVAFLLVPLVAWIASLGKGYLPPLGFAILLLFVGMIFGATGWGKWVPWSIVPLYAGVAGPRVEVLAPGSLLVVVLTFVVGVVLTIRHWARADNVQ